MTWFIQSIDAAKSYLNLRDDEASGVSVEYWLLPDDLELGDEVDIQWDSGQWNNEGWGQRVRRVDWNGETLVDMSDDYMDMKHKLYLYEVKMRNERNAFLNREENERRMANLIEPFQIRLNRFLAEDPDFAKQSMGLEYELMICEQAQMLYEISQDKSWRGQLCSQVEHPDRGFIDDPTPNQALEAWWSLNTAFHKYNYREQYKWIPDWEQGHSGLTASSAYQFARLLNNGETNF